MSKHMPTPAVKSHRPGTHAGLQVLHQALSLKRPHGGKGVKRLASFIRSRLSSSSLDLAGNIHVDLRCKAEHKTLFVAHLDTVHRQDGPNRYIREGPFIHAQGQVPLGADDGAGVGVLMHLIEHGIGGYYIFTQGEEVGGIGAKFIRNNQEALLAQFDRAIAFDRRDTFSVITHQGMSRCCSDDFAQGLADQLNHLDMLYMPDDTGSYTDTAEFCDVIAECTNISVGYMHEHTPQERLDLGHFTALCDAVLRIDWDALPVKRDPRQIEDLWGDESWYWGDDAGFQEDLNQALSRAQRGSCSQLHDMLSELFPVDQRLIVRKLLERERIPATVLENAQEMIHCGFGDAYDALHFILDELEPLMMA